MGQTRPFLRIRIVHVVKNHFQKSTLVITRAIYYENDIYDLDKNDSIYMRLLMFNQINFLHK